MATFKYEVCKDRKRKDGTYNVKIRITHNRQIKRLATSIYVTKDDVTKGFKIKNQQIIEELEKIIISYRSKCNTLSLYIRDMSMDELVNVLTRTSEDNIGVDFITFAREWIENNGQKSSIGIYKSALNALVRFLGRDKLSFKELNYAFLKSFEEYLGQRRAMSLYMGAIRHLYNEAKLKYNDEDADSIRIPWSPFKKYVIPATPSLRERALDISIVREIFMLPYILNKNGEEKQCLYNFAKDMFILSFCLMGMNSADLYLCTDIKNGIITYNRAKTASRRLDRAKMCVAIPNEIIWLYEKYKDIAGERVFSFYKRYGSYQKFNTGINDGLKKIGNAIGVDDLEFYSARHSWASIARNELKVDKATVGEALNHVDKENSVTDIYIKKDYSLINEVNRRVVNLVLGNVNMQDFRPADDLPSAGL